MASHCHRLFVIQWSNTKKYLFSNFFMKFFVVKEKKRKFAI